MPEDERKSDFENHAAAVNSTQRLHECEDPAAGP